MRTQQSKALRNNTNSNQENIKHNNRYCTIVRKRHHIQSSAGDRR
jgi:hypothetical protein